MGDQDYELDLDLFMHGEYLRGFEPTIKANYSPQQREVYRIIHNPVEEGDYIVSALKGVPKGGSLEFVVPYEELDDTERLKYVNHYAFSTNIRLEGNVEMMQYLVDKRRNPQKKDALLDSMGRFIAKVQIKEEHGLLINKPEENGHLNFLPKKDFKWEENILEILPYTVKINDGNE